jgi:hypothetical protein
VTLIVQQKATADSSPPTNTTEINQINHTPTHIGPGQTNNRSFVFFALQTLHFSFCIFGQPSKHFKCDSAKRQTDKLTNNQTNGSLFPVFLLFFPLPLSFPPISNSPARKVAKLRRKSGKCFVFPTAARMT